MIIKIKENVIQPYKPKHQYSLGNLYYLQQPSYPLNSLMFNRSNALTLYQMPVKETLKDKEILCKIPQSESDKKFEK